jgi:hypothetical protein
VISPTNSVERDQLKRDCSRHAAWPNGLIDWEAYELGLHGHNLFSDLSSDSDNSDCSGSDSDCVFLYANSRTYPRCNTPNFNFSYIIISTYFCMFPYKWLNAISLILHVHMFDSYCDILCDFGDKCSHDYTIFFDKMIILF